jgi:urea transport system permease protein
VLIIGQQGYTGGVNGITDLKTCSAGTSAPTAQVHPLLRQCGLLLGHPAVPLDQEQARHAAAGDARQGRPRALLRLRRRRTSRSSPSAWPPAVGIGGAMFTLQVGFMSPSFVGIVPSIEMVIFAAVGGRMSLVGAVYGTLLVNFGKTYFSESFPQLWLFLMAGCSSAW